MPTLFRALPSVDALLTLLAATDLAAQPRPLVRQLVNDFLDHCRKAIRDGRIDSPGQLSPQTLLPRLAAFVAEGCKPHFRRVVNATGVVVHTNLGRSLLCDEAIAAVDLANRRYSNLEFDLSTGKRGSRYSHVEDILLKVTGAEAAMVVNNNAAAVLLALDTLARGREVVVSRGQLVEIGGSFRIPEVMARSGAVLREVGATNRTHLRDYEGAICEETAALMQVHTSNYRIVGFHSEVPLGEMVALGRERGLPVLVDLGSGAFVDFAPLGLGWEPTVQQTVAAGPDVATFSVPTLRMIFRHPDDLKKDAQRLVRCARQVLGDAASVLARPGVSRVGGGAFPEADLPTWLVRVETGAATVSPEALRDALLRTEPPLVGRIEDGAFCLDPRTLAQDEFRLAAGLLRQALDALTR